AEREIPRAGLVAPRNEIEEVLAAFWRELLGKAELSVEDNFFDLGGHSLHAARLIARLEESLAVGLSVRTLYEAPTLARLALRVEEAMLAGASGADPSAAADSAQLLRTELSRVRGEAAVRMIPSRPAGGPAPLSWSQELLWFVDQLEPGANV